MSQSQPLETYTRELDHAGMESALKIAGQTPNLYDKIYLAAEQACILMIREIARDGREAIECGDYALIGSAQARDELFKRVTGRIPAAKPTQLRG